jgi:hypothetical protein
MGCSCRTSPEEYEPRQGCFRNGVLTLKPTPVGVPETPPIGRTSGGVLV